RYARSFGDIGKSAVMIVVIKAVFAKISDINIWPAVVVVIADGNAKSRAFVGYAGFIRNVAKSAIVIIVKQHGPRRRFFSFEGCDGGTVEQIYIEPAVVVVVEQSHAGTWHLNNRAFIR